MPSSIDELFPPSPRVLYKKAPLVQVLFQLKFPRLLAIETQPPASFQERIRHAFPLLERGTGIALPALQGLPSEVMQLLNSQMGGVSYQFLTADRAHVVSLTPDSMSLTTTAYTQWRDFLGQLSGPLSALNEIYSPSFFTRVGLRYLDAINRESIGLGARSWSDLLRPHLLDALAFPKFEANVETVGHQIRMRLPDGSGTVTLRHGYGVVIGKPGMSYAIDFDFSKEPRVEVADVEPTINHFNQLSGRAFRWCLSDELHNALQPEPLE